MICMKMSHFMPKKRKLWALIYRRIKKLLSYNNRTVIPICLSINGLCTIPLMSFNHPRVINLNSYFYSFVCYISYYSNDPFVAIIGISLNNTDIIV